MMQICLGYPNEQEENDILRRYEREDPMDELLPVMSGEQLLELQAQVRLSASKTGARVPGQGEAVPPASTLPWSRRQPRGTMALYRTCQALAALRGPGFVVPDDIKEMAPYVLTHRIHISPQTRLRGRLPQEIIQQIVSEVPVPVVS